MIFYKAFSRTKPDLKTFKLIFKKEALNIKGKKVHYQVDVIGYVL